MHIPLVDYALVLNESVRVKYLFALKSELAEPKLLDRVNADVKLQFVPNSSAKPISF